MIIFKKKVLKFYETNKESKKKLSMWKFMKHLNGKLKIIK